MEKGFCINRQVTVEYLKERPFIAQRTIHDHLLHIGGLDAKEWSFIAQMTIHDHLLHIGGLDALAEADVLEHAASGDQRVNKNPQKSQTNDICPTRTPRKFNPHPHGHIYQAICPINDNLLRRSP